MKVEQIGRYEIRRELGRGGMATVYLAYDPHIQRQVAIKVLPRQFMHDPKYLSRFQQEAQVIARLEHPAIVPIYDFGEEDDAPYLVMRYMAGGSLRDRMNGKPQPLDEVALIFNRLGQALDHAHELGIIHRDLKPSNILFDDQGNAYLADFGIAQIAGKTLSTTGVIGTPAYMSPEQIIGKVKLDGRSDIYTLGTILYQLLAGKTPYDADTTGQMYAHVHEPIPAIREVNPDLPPGTQQVIEKAMAKDREQRYQSGTELAAAVNALLHPEPAAVIGSVAINATGEAKPVNASAPVVDEHGRTLNVGISNRKSSLLGWVWWIGALVLLGMIVLSVRSIFIDRTANKDGSGLGSESSEGEGGAGLPNSDVGSTDGPPPDVMEEGSIWVLLPDRDSSTRWETDDRRYFGDVFKAAGVEYNIVNAEGDARSQQTQFEQAITAGAKVILLVNLDSGSAEAMIASAREADVKVIDYDRLTIEGLGADVYVSFDSVAVGRIMGEVLEPLINGQEGTPQVVLLNGAPTDYNAILFREGYASYTQPHFDDGSWELVDEQAVPNWDNRESYIIFEQILTAAENNVTAVFAANDDLANEVISAFKNAGIDPGDAGIPISGQDATVSGIQHVLAGDQAMSVYKPIKAETEAAAAAAIALWKGEDLTEMTEGMTISNGTNDIPFIALTPIAVTKENVADTVIADGFRTWEEICVGEFQQYCP